MSFVGKAVPTLPEALTRLLRHEVGDLLQTVYAAVAILQKRLPPESSLERRILTDMRARGETCKILLDAVHDFVCPVSLAFEEVDLGELTTRLAAVAGQKYPQLKVTADVAMAPRLVADGKRLAQAGEAILTNACEAAQSGVKFIARTRKPEQAEWLVEDDGPGVPEDNRGQMFQPFYTTRHAHAGLGLPLAEKIVCLHDGRIFTESIPEGGFRVIVRLPLHRPAP
jgi:signal transduction histidine kinase